jgi:hypothetical protein
MWFPQARRRCPDSRPCGEARYSARENWLVGGLAVRGAAGAPHVPSTTAACLEGTADEGTWACMRERQSREGRMRDVEGSMRDVREA